MVHEKRIFVESFDVNNRLAELNLTSEILIQSVEIGQSAWANCTENHPPQFRGIAAWANTVRALRDKTVVRGFSRSNESNLPFTVGPDGDVAILVNTGDDSTGKPEGEPCTKSRKGPHTKSAVRANALQYSLGFQEPLTDEEVRAVNEPTTWILLIYRDIQAHEVRCELSRPINMNAEGIVDGWDERIILGAIPFGGDVLEIPRDENPQTPNITITVNRRA